MNAKERKQITADEKKWATEFVKKLNADIPATETEKRQIKIAVLKSKVGRLLNRNISRETIVDRLKKDGLNFNESELAEIFKPRKKSSKKETVRND
ncbi:hypothetical protein AGMMS49959_18400 [Planctomycetales bacterium]|nr:hypothetical protein AGMMS49959_18400 [Planctomycetales bacterium]